MKAKLTPMVFEYTDHDGERRKGCEKVLLSFQEFPEALIYIDFLVNNVSLQNRLYDGETLYVEITVKEC